MYHYFISYHHVAARTGSWGFGAVELRRDVEIKSWEALAALTAEIEKMVNKNSDDTVKVVIVNWRLF